MMWLQLHGLQCLVTVTAAVIAVVGGCAAAAVVVAAVAHTFLSTRNVHDVVGPCVVVLVNLTVCAARNLLLVLWQDQ